MLKPGGLFLKLYMSYLKDDPIASRDVMAFVDNKALQKFEAAPNFPLEAASYHL